MKLLPTNFFILLPFIVAFLAFIIFYSRAIIFFGLKKLRRFTVILLGAFVVLFLLHFIKYFSETGLIPSGIIDISYDARYRIIKLIGLAAVSAFTIYKINKEKYTHWLTAAWVIIALLNIGEIIWQGFYYISWEEPVISANTNTPDTVRVILEHTMNRSNYLSNMIYPACWILLSVLSLVKIRKEKIRQVVHTYPSYSKIASL